MATEMDKNIEKEILLNHSGEKAQKISNIIVER